MSLHQERTHPDFVEGCFGCKLSTLQLSPGDAARPMAQKKWDKELADYKKARAQGVQPAGTTTAAVRKAMDLSEKAGKAFNADTGSFN